MTITNTHDTITSTTSTDAARADWLQWRQDRKAALSGPTSPLAIVALHWLDETPRELADLPGHWSHTGGDDPDAVVTDLPSTFAGHPVRAGDDALAQASLDVHVDEAQATWLLRIGERRVQVIRRTGRYGVRVYDADAPALVDFTGVAVHDLDLDWVVEGEFVRSEPTGIVVPGALPGLVHHQQAIGEFRFVRNGIVTTLQVLDGQPPAISFRDPSTAEVPNGWRRVTLEIDPVTGTRATVDFNRAQHFPAVFNEYGTCPHPPAGNTIAFPVTAGESFGS